MGKAMKAMKTMKKAMKVSKIAKGKRARASVFAGGKEKTQSGLTKANLVKSKAGRIVSKAQSAATKKRYAGSKAQKWAKAVRRPGRNSTSRASFLSEARLLPARPCMPKPRPSTTLEFCLLEGGTAFHSSSAVPVLRALDSCIIG